jgi:dihydroorotase
VIDAGGLWAFPGLTDMHAHLREPGGGEAETIASGLRAALAGGFTRVAAMPNTTPPIDDAASVALQLEASRVARAAELVPVGCVTKGRLGRELADLACMARAGARAFSDDGAPVSDRGLLALAVDLAEALGCVVIEHPEDTTLTAGGAVNAGPVAERLGVRGIPQEGETGAVASALETARNCRGRLHLTHLSLPGSVRMTAEARASGIRVTCDATPHHLALDESAVLELGPDAKMNPPLRSAADRTALADMAAAGGLDAVASDHAPHTAAAKSAGLASAPFGVTSVETMLPVVLGTLCRERGMRLLEALALMSARPSAILGLPPAPVSEGRRADLVLFDPDAEWTPGPGTMLSRSGNTPFRGRSLTGRVRAVWRGSLAYTDGSVV